MPSPRVSSARFSQHSLSPNRSHVPKHMGWLWKAKDVDMPNYFQLLPGWKPGAIRASTLKQMKKHSHIQQPKERQRRHKSPTFSPTRYQKSFLVNTATVRINSSHSNNSSRSCSSSNRSSSYHMNEGRGGIVRLTRHRNGNYAVTFHKSDKKSCKDKVKNFFRSITRGISSDTSVSDAERCGKRYVARARFNGVDIEKITSKDSFVFDFPVKI